MGVSKIGRRGTVVIPAPLRRRFGMEEGSIVLSPLKCLAPRASCQAVLGPTSRKFRNWPPYTWRYRIGAWRFSYEIDEGERIALMIAAAHRGSAY